VVPTPRHAGWNPRSRGHLTALGAVVFDHNGGGDAGHRAEQRVCWTHDAAWLFQGGMGRRQKVMHKMLIDALTLHKKVVLAHLVPQGRLSTPSTSQKSSHPLSLIMLCRAPDVPRLLCRRPRAPSAPCASKPLSTIQNRLLTRIQRQQIQPGRVQKAQVCSHKTRLAHEHRLRAPGRGRGRARRRRRPSASTRVAAA
jgi:hypothetical protein